MPTPFPPLRPTDRRFRPGVIPQTTARTVNGRTVRRLLASKQGGAELELTYENITDTDVEQLRQAHRAAKGRYEPLTLPPEVWAGDSDLEAFVAFMPQNTAWRFSGEIEVQWAKRGRATATVRLRSYTRTLLTVLPPPVVIPPPAENPELCAWVNTLLPDPLRQTDMTAAFSTDGQRVYVWGEIPGPGTNDVRGAMVCYDIDGNLLWAKEIDPQTVNFEAASIVELPDKSVIGFARWGSSPWLTHTMYRFSSAGLFLESKYYGPAGVPSVIVDTTFALTVPLLNVIAATVDGPGIALFSAVDLSLIRARRATTVQSNQRIFFDSNTQRFVVAGYSGSSGQPVIRLFELSPDIITTTQKYNYYFPQAEMARYDSFAMDSFGAIYGYHQNANTTVAQRGSYICKMSASAGGFIPLFVKRIPTITGDPTAGPSAAEKRIDIKPDGSCLLFFPDTIGSTDYFYIYEIDPTFTTFLHRTVAVLPTGQSQVEKIANSENFYSADYTQCLLPIERFGVASIPLDLPIGITLTLLIQGRGNMTVRREVMNRALEDLPTHLPPRAVEPTSMIEPATSTTTRADTATDLTNRYSFNRAGQCVVVNQGFLVSETTSNASLDIGPESGNYHFSQTLITRQGSVYWTGRATVGTSAWRYFLMKYDSNGNQLWARWLEGDYSSGTNDAVGTTTTNPVMCEGPTDGVFVAVKGLGGGSLGFNNNFMGSSMRIHLFTATGALINTAAWQFANNGFGRAKYEDTPGCIFYEPTQQRLYVAGIGASYTVLRALTLDQPYGVAANTTSQSGQRRMFWLADKQRIVIAGYQHPADGGSGFFVREFSPDLQTQYQAYSYTGSHAAWSFGMDAFGAIYAVDAGRSPDLLYITKLSASDGGYAVIWTRTIPIELPGGFVSSISMFGTSIDFLPDGSAVVTLQTGGADAARGYWFNVWTFAPDFSETIAHTRLEWGAFYPHFNQAMGPRLDPVKQIVSFASGLFTVGITSIQLPAVTTSLPVDSTIQNGLTPKTIEARTRYLPVVMTNYTPQPSKGVLSAPLLDMNPMVAWGESAWSTSDLTATVNHVTKATGPLVVPPQITPPVVRDTLIDLRFEGANLSTTFVDSSPYNRTLALVSGTGGPWISTAQFTGAGSTSSLRCNGGGSGKQGRISCGTSADYTPGLGDFDMICDVYAEGAWGIFSLPALTGGTVLELFMNNSSQLGNNLGLLAPMVLNQWVRIRYARFQQEIRLIIGATEYRIGSAHNFNGNNLIVGYGGGFPFTGYIDNFRYTAGGILEPWPS